MKKKLNQDDLAMIIADMEHGELTTCSTIDCEKCPLDLEITLGKENFSICYLLTKVSERLNEPI